MRSRFRVLSILALLHAYIGWRLCTGLELGIASSILVTLGLVLSCTLMPLAVFVDRIHDRIAWAGYLMMGLFSSLLVLTLLRDLVLAALWIFSLLTPEISFYSALAVVVLGSLTSLIGLINARRLARVVHVDVPLKDLPAALQGFTIAQISDIHIGHTIKRGFLEAVVNQVNGLNPDLIAVTGDVVDGDVERLGAHTQPLAGLKARYGSYLVTGNHEYYSGVHQWTEEFRRLGLGVLLNEHVTVEHRGATLLVAGVTDFSAARFDPTHRSDPHSALAGAPEHASHRILLAHQPRSAHEAEKAGFHLQISGHTHGGQFWPWNLFVPMQQPFLAGLDRLNEMLIYTSRGTGYWGPPKRFGAPSEITLLRLVSA
ncbi:metallophosphoesterase [Marinobacterium mangrovicola]|uniref:Calcineurin-like phosphoesterase domain-containing protein n=1 Tax=Marinobacterium mangrovicola TaxID=1476959 RepID=A0A4V2PCR1_9GAMM|nr:metallophosphoesterase [Marinobacterium mangrovicola]TCK02316.1 hypothetical protein CLV83_4499 [Marinobacterium mangrovicola]